MDLIDQLPPELAQFEMNPALTEWVVSLFQANTDLAESNKNLLDKTKSDARIIQQSEQQLTISAQQHQLKDTKIQALTFELAHYKRIRFANKSEPFSAEQRELFEESWNTDTSALDAEIEQSAAEVEQIEPRVKSAKRLNQPNAKVQAVNHSPAICPVSNIVMNRSPVPAVSVAKR